MKLIYAGKYDGNVDSLPHAKHKKGAVMFKEPTDMKKLALIVNVIAVIIAIPFIAFVIIYGGLGSNDMLITGLLLLGAMFVHEYLHAICFHDTVFIYENFRQGLMFVIGIESMSCKRFVFMSLCPNLVLGVLPFLIFCLLPQYTILGYFGALNIGMGAGDYMNVFNAVTQVPKGAKIYMHKMNTYWYMPDQDSEND